MTKNFHPSLSSREERSETEQQQILHELKKVSKPKLNKFVAGSLKNFYLNWKSITNDEIILDIKNDLKIDFKERPVNIPCVPKIHHSTKEKEIMNSEIQNLLDKGVIVQCDREPNDFVSTVFTREQKDGSSRTILNLKYLNEFVIYTSRWSLSQMHSKQ